MIIKGYFIFRYFATIVSNTFIQIYAIHYSIHAYVIFNFAMPSACLPACKYNL